MTDVEISLPDQTVSEIERLVDTGDFINEDQAVEELLSMGISAYRTTEDRGTETEENLFTQMENDRQDPAMQNDDQGDDYTF